jgi:hypothetical protein
MGIIENLMNNFIKQGSIPMIKSFRFALLSATCLAVIGLAPTTKATVTTLSFQPSPSDMGDLDHHLVYAWRIDNIAPGSPVNVTSATLTFTNIANWDSNPNMLFVWLMDTAAHPGVTTVQDVDASQVPVVDIADAFLGSMPGLVSDATKKTKLFQHSFTTTPTTYTYTFTSLELTALTNYINSGHDIAFGFDPDCHFFNDGITFTMSYSPVPEATTVIPMVCVVALAIAWELRRRRLALA